MSDLIVPNIICFQTQKQLATLNNIGELLKGDLIHLHAHNFVHAKTSLHAWCMHACHCVCNLSSSITEIFFSSLLFIKYVDVFKFTILLWRPSTVYA